MRCEHRFVFWIFTFRLGILIGYRVYWVYRVTDYRRIRKFTALCMYVYSMYSYQKTSYCSHSTDTGYDGQTQKYTGNLRSNGRTFLFVHPLAQSLPSVQTWDNRLGVNESIGRALYSYFRISTNNTYHDRSYPKSQFIVSVLVAPFTKHILTVCDVKMTKQ